MKTKLIAGTATAITALGLFVSQAFAINDVFVPADECVSYQSSAVGNPEYFSGVNHGIDTYSDPVGRPVSSNNPGQSTGAKGEANSEAPNYCN